MADNTPLAAWISFDPSRLSFTGRTPPAESLVQPPQRFAFQVIASDVVGFAGSALGFDIYVGNHQLAADETVVVLNATRGTVLSYTGLRDTVRVDGQPADGGTVSIASTPNIPPWLSVNKHTWQMTGVPPETAESTNFTVTLRDTFANNLNLTISIELDGDKSSLFTGSLPKFTITAGKPFSFDLRPYLLNPEDTEVSV
jgi:axial budding pattern protein 2